VLYWCGKARIHGTKRGTVQGGRPWREICSKLQNARPGGSPGVAGQGRETPIYKAVFVQREIFVNNAFRR